MNALFSTRIVALGAPLCFGMASAQAMDSYEPNDSRAMATVAKDLKNAEWKEVKGVTYHAGSDEDWFKIVLAKKGLLQVEVTYGKKHWVDLTRADGSPLTGDNGPGTLAISNGNLEPGTYVLELRPLEGGTGDVKLRIRYSDPTTYRGWLIDYKESPDLPSDADPNGDGIPLGIEWVFRRPVNADPTFGNPVIPSADGFGMLYFVRFDTIDGTRQPVRIEMSSDLREWTLVPRENITSGVLVNPIPAGQTNRVDLFFRWEETPSALYVRVATDKVQ